MKPHSFRIGCVASALVVVAALPLPGAPPLTDCHGDPLPEGALARMGTTRLRHSDGVCHVAYSPNGKLLASLSRDRTLRVWDAASGRQLHLFYEKSADFSIDYYAVAWSPDGRTLAAAGDDPFHGSKAGIRFFDLNTGKESERFNCSSPPPYFLAYSSDGKLLVSVCPGQVVRWDLASGEMLSEWKLDRTAALDISPDRKTIAWVDGENEDKTVHVCDIVTGQEIRRLRGHQWAIVSVAFSPDGKYIASGNPLEPIHLWNVESGNVIRRFEHQQAGMQLKFSPDGKTLACGCMDGSARRWDVDTGKELPLLTGYRGWVNEIAFSPEGKSLALAGADSQVIHLWDLATAKERFPAPGHRGQISALAFSPDGKLLATGGGDWHDNDEAIYLWNAATGTEVCRLTGHLGKVCCLQFSPDGKWLVSGSEKESTFRIWDAATGKEKAKFRRHAEDGDQAEDFGVSAVAFSPDGKYLVSAHDQGLLILWDAKKRSELLAWKGHEGMIHSVAFSPDGKLLLSGSVDHLVRLWDVPTGKENRRLGDMADPVKCVSFSPDGRLIAACAGDYEGITCLWEAATGRELIRLPASQGHVSQIAFSPDGKLLAGTGADNSLVLWEVATRRERCRFPGHPNGGLVISFSPDGRTIASGSQDTTVLLWDAGHTPGLLRPRTEQDLDMLWTDLGSEDAKLANRAICALLAEPDQAVKLFNQRLRPFGAMDADRLAKALVDLDNDRFQVREKATNELARLGELAEPFLRQTLDRQPSLEVRRRVQLLLTKLETATLAPDQLRTLRAFEVLERIGGGDARAVFQAHARQQPAGPLGREAQACLDRLMGRER
jgi:WD40 repeat protein